MEQIPSDCEEEKDGEDKEEEEEDRSRTKTKPTIIGSYEWGSRPLDSFSSVEGDGLFYTNYWNGTRCLGYGTKRLLENAQRSLVAAQDGTSIELGYNIDYHYHRQVPYREFRYALPSNFSCD